MHATATKKQSVIAIKTSRLAFVVIKLRLAGKPYFLLRKNPKWKDVNFIGGHQEDRDGSPLRAARRELFEEVPSIRRLGGVTLVPLIEHVSYGPIFSRSSGANVLYEIDFFLLNLASDPNHLLTGLAVRTQNRLIAEEALKHSGKIRVSSLVDLLDKLYAGGISSIPYSSTLEIMSAEKTKVASGTQLNLDLKICSD